MRSIHDNNVYAIDIRCEKKEIILHTEFLEEDSPEYTDVIFKNAIAHHFEHVWQGNILLDIEEFDPNDFYRNHESELKNARRYGFPIAVETLDAFLAEINENGLKIYAVDPSYGLSGWVICSGIEHLINDKKRWA